MNDIQGNFEIIYTVGYDLIDYFIFYIISPTIQ